MSLLLLLRNPSQFLTCTAAACTATATTPKVDSLNVAGYAVCSATATTPKVDSLNIPNFASCSATVTTPRIDSLNIPDFASCSATVTTPRIDSLNIPDFASCSATAGIVRAGVVYPTYAAAYAKACRLLNSQPNRIVLGSAPVGTQDQVSITISGDGAQLNDYVSDATVIGDK